MGDVDRPASLCIAVRGTQQQIGLVQILWGQPRAIFTHEFPGHQNVGAIVLCQSKGICEQAAPVIMTAPGDIRDAAVQLIADVNSGRAGGSEIAILGEIGALVIIDVVDQFGDQEIEVRITLTMAVGGHIDRNAIDAAGKIGAMIQIVPAQEILVSLAVARMLRDDQAGYGFQSLARAQQRHFAQ